jgi:NADH pyrophosphatase NudC (nudix superfamily)
MELGAIFLLLGVLVIIIAFVAQPFTTHWRARAQSSHEVSALLAERERAINALLELDTDNATGKIPAEEYSSQRAGLIRKGADILRQLDEIQKAIPAPVKETIRQVVAETTTNAPTDEDLEDLISMRRTIRQQKTAGFCPSCGKPILQSDQFCPSCGQKLNSK